MTVHWGEGMAATASIWPALLQLSGAFLPWISAIVLLVAGRNEPRRGWDAAALGFVGGTLVLAGLGLGPMLLGGIGYAAPSCVDCGPRAVEAFAPIVAIEVLLVLVGVVGGGVSLGALALRQWAVPVAPIVGIGLLFGAAIGELFGVGHTIALSWAGNLPMLEAHGPMWVHVGRSWTPKVPPPEGRFVLAPLDPWTPTEPGVRPLRVTAVAPGLSAWREVEVRAGEERGSPLFPIRQGNTWTYVPFESHGASPRVLFDGGETSYKQQDDRVTVVRIAAPRDAGPLRAWVVQVTDPSGNTGEQLIAAFEGEVHLVSPEGEDEGPFVAWRDQRPRDGVVDVTDGCQFALWEGLPCRCTIAPGGPLARPPGPTECAKREGDSIGWALFRVFTVAVTIGIADPGSDAHAQGVTLSSFVPGDGPSIPPQPSLVIDEDLAALLRSIDAADWDSEKRQVLVSWLGDRRLPADAAAAILDRFDFQAKVEAFQVLRPRLADPGDAARLVKKLTMLTDDERAALLR